MSDTEPVSRTAAWVTREYGQDKWPVVGQLVDSACVEEGPHPSLSRVLRRVARQERGRGAAAQAAVIGGQRVEVPPSVAWAAHDGFVVETVAAACIPSTDLIVDLGSGWGKHLLSVWLAGGPRDALYVGAEYTAAGRHVASRLAALSPQIRFRSLPFDYRQPDLHELNGHQEAVLFSVHSAEQVPELPPAALDELAGIAPSVTCLHFESVGWQIAGDGAGSSQAYARRNDYNRNLVQLLADRQAAGVLTVESTWANVVGVNPENATSLVVWQSVR